MLTLDDVLLLGGFLAVALAGVGLWTRRERARAHALAERGRTEEAQALHDRLDVLTPIAVLGVVAGATLLLVV